MKVLLTGANGFVGSHVLEVLRNQGLATVVLLRPRSNTRFIASHLDQVEVRFGAIDDLASLKAALAGVTHVIHCAGCTKAIHTSTFYEVNQAGTARMVEAIAAQGGQVQRLVHISSLAAAGPALPDRPRLETDVPAPVSEYGRSKLAGEGEVRKGAVDYVILRPPAVYGPRDGEFLRLFKAVRSHLLPQFGGGRQALSMVFVRDLAEATVAVLTHPSASKQTYYVARAEVVTAGQLARQIARQTGSWTLPLSLPTSILWPVCAGQEIISRLTGHANVLSRQKYAELRADGWVCDPSKLRRDIGFSCATNLEAGLAATLDWYRHEGWL